ncbi:MAG TPA: NUDIX domain-containing protein [Azospirillaceae bacterium]|nr:NUDIX domain-containing protein [Azospirillaceae bacterium]
MSERKSGPGRVELIAAETGYKGRFEIRRYRLRHELYRGGMGPEITREVFERGHAVAVLLHDPKADALVFVEQFRAGAYAAGIHPWLLETVAGIIDEGETAAEVAAREAKEETGLEASDLFHVYDYLPSPGGCSETISFFAGRVDTTGMGGHAGLEEEHEDIRVRAVPSDEALAWLDRDEVRNAVTLVALHWFARNRDMLRRRWS